MSPAAVTTSDLNGMLLDARSVTMADHLTQESERLYWDDWNTRYRVDSELTPLNRRQLEVATGLCLELGLSTAQNSRILEIGCGTGWLSNALAKFGSVEGIDPSPAAIEWGQRHFPAVRLRVGEFETMPIAGQFDLIVCSEVLAHVPDQQRFVDRIVSLLKPGGALLLITQNGFVWRRSSYLLPPAKGLRRNWPSVSELRRLLRALEIQRVASIDPGGDRGVLMAVKLSTNWRIRRVAPRIADAVYAAWERVLAGRDLVVVARKA